MSPDLRLAAVAFLAAGTMLFDGCAGTKPGGPVTIKGELATGVECPVVVTATGRRYSVTGSLGSFKTGDRVCVRGRIVEVSICMQGYATVSIEAIGPENDCP